MVIEIPGCKFRIKGTNYDWRVEYPSECKDGRGYEGKYFYPSLETAVAKAYELALRGSDAEGDLEAALGECRRVRDELVKAVREAVA